MHMSRTGHGMALWVAWSFVAIFFSGISNVDTREMTTCGVGPMLADGSMRTLSPFSRTASPVSRSVSPCARLAAVSLTTDLADDESVDVESEPLVEDDTPVLREEIAKSPLEIEGVSEALLQALGEAGITTLTPVQVACIPHCLKGSDVLAKAKTGTGKTLGFLIPSCERLLRNTHTPCETPGGVDPISALVLSSTRELATQISAQATQLTTHLPEFNLEEITGGASITNQRERLDNSDIARFACKYSGTVDLMIATPGRLLEHIETTPHFAARLQAVEILVLDEVDQLLEGGFKRAIETIISYLPAQRQTLCFSATIPAKIQPVLGLAMGADHVTVDCVGEEEVDTHAKIEQGVLVHPIEQSLAALYATIRDEMARRPDDYKIIAFLPTARATQFHTAVLLNMGLSVMQIHSRCSQSERAAVADTFRSTAKTILLSSDVSARGVDYPDVSLVVQVSAPTGRDQYVQRLGRTGRAGKTGRGVLLLCDYEQGFLTRVKDLPIARIAPTLASANEEEVSALGEAAAAVDGELASQTYRAWIMAMVGQRKMLKWSKEDMVKHANLFATHVLQRADRPTLQRSLAATLGLGAVEGLVLVDAPSEEEVAASARAEQKEEEEAARVLVLKIHKKELGLGLLKDAKQATAALEALGEAEALQLQATLETKGEAMVAGLRICKSMVTIAHEKVRTGNGGKGGGKK